MLTPSDYDNTAGTFPATKQPRLSVAIDGCAVTITRLSRFALTSTATLSRLDENDRLLFLWSARKIARSIHLLFFSTMSTTANNRTLRICRKVGVATPIQNANFLFCHVITVSHHVRERRSRRTLQFDL